MRRFMAGRCIGEMPVAGADVSGLLRANPAMTSLPEPRSHVAGLQLCAALLAKKAAWEN
jgi:hypothetical protein